ncbi:hypothetical protein SAMN05421736_11067 [Evansella caseinilytica]|uniref:Uncharacterized protein n=1 Tax=Evansella caseinilytica TaxID=1503961 RepID=A0A1H3S877_9BACI|nr:hypothetical protein SAMN05421736_11067 [Evansella caseinilytica]
MLSTKKAALIPNEIGRCLFQLLLKRIFKKLTINLFEQIFKERVQKGIGSVRYSP